MARLLRSTMALGLAAGIAGAVGFVAFADAVRHLEPHADARADAIVVLTGDEARISTGMQLLEAGRANRMLISGVHPATRVPTELKRHIGGSQELIRCCVDIGHDAVNTSGNADEARQWARGRGYRSLIVVTSSYHLPRSLVEFARLMPGMRVVGYPAVSSRHLQLDDWWRHAPTLRLLAGEYVKLLGSAARLGLARIAPGEQQAPPAREPQPHTADGPRSSEATR
jgi:uncharacterized SAM-binding protein YcdF (DUF218 family)